MSAVTYEGTGHITWLKLNPPAGGNGIMRRFVDQLESCVERADLDPEVHALLLAGARKGFWGGYDLAESADYGSSTITG
jgi:enoyl-CoA hydratase